jgi:hypothetical protein
VRQLTLVTVIFNRSVEKFVEKGAAASGKSRITNHFYRFAPICSSSLLDLTDGIPTGPGILERSSASAQIMHEIWKRSCSFSPGSRLVAYAMGRESITLDDGEANED